VTRNRALPLLLLVLGGCPEGDSSTTVKDAGGPGAKGPTAQALLELAKGQVTLERQARKTPAQLGYLYVKDALETGEDGQANVRLAGGRLLELGPEGRFVLQEGEGGLVLNVSQGLVLTRNVTDEPSQPLPGPSVQLTIMTPFGFTRMGTDPLELTLTVNPTGTNVDVKFGQVDMVSTDGTVTQIGAGQNGRLGGTTLELNLEPIQVTIVAAGGKSELKRKDDTRWTALPAKKAVGIDEGDSFRVKNGRAVMQAPGGLGTLAFAPGSEVVMEKAKKGEGIEETGFDLKKGELASQSPGKTRLNLAGGVTLSTEAESQFVVRRTKDGYQVDSTAGDVKVERDGQTPETVFGGRTASIPEKGAVKSSEVGREPITLPARSAMKVFHNNAGRAAIVWDGEPNKPYRIEVATDPAYKQKIISGVVHQRHMNVTVPPRGSLYWHVFEGEKEFAKGSASFGPEPSTTDLARNRNDVQDGADQTTIYFQDKPPSVTFTWQPTAEAAKYKVQVYRKDDLSTPVAEKVIAEDKLSLPEGALGEGSYLWSVKSLDAKGAEVGSSGKMNKLVITYDNAVPNLMIKTPHNGDAGGARVRCSGIAPVGAKVSINGKPVSLDEKSRFDQDIAPSPNGLLVFRMVNGASEVYTVRKVRRSR
jgi:hypothetical protein